MPIMFFLLETQNSRALLPIGALQRDTVFECRDFRLIVHATYQYSMLVVNHRLSSCYPVKAIRLVCHILVRMGRRET